jgi:hypothetical protein
VSHISPRQCAQPQDQEGGGAAARREPYYSAIDLASTWEPSVFVKTIMKLFWKPELNIMCGSKCNRLPLFPRWIKSPKEDSRSRHLTESKGIMDLTGSIVESQERRISWDAILIDRHCDNRLSFQTGLLRSFSVLRLDFRDHARIRIARRCSERWFLCKNR